MLCCSMQDMCVTDHLPRTWRNPARSEDEGGNPTSTGVPKSQLRSEDEVFSEQESTSSDDESRAAVGKGSGPASSSSRNGSSQVSTAAASVGAPRGAASSAPHS